MYSLEAVLGSEPDVRAAASPWTAARVVPLAAGVAMIPLTDEVKAGLAPEYGSAAEEHVARFPEFRSAVPRWLREASRSSTLAYVGAEFFGGRGVQWAVVMKGGAVVLGPLHEGDAINRTLQLLGVKPAGGNDEFDTVGLGRCRSTEDWAER